MNDSWRSVGNSVLETNRIEAVEKIYLVFGKMGGDPQVRWGHYADSVVHVRTSHVPRFEVELFGGNSLFGQMGLDYDAFRGLAMDKKMEHIRACARARLKKGERLWWLEDVGACRACTAYPGQVVHLVDNGREKPVPGGGCLAVSRHRGIRSLQKQIR